MDKGTHSANNLINLYELLWGKEKNVVRWVLHITYQEFQSVKWSIL